MQKTITRKDLSIFFLLLLLFIFMLLTMYQIDRQWQKLAQLEQHLSEQNQDMRALRRLVNDLPHTLAQHYSAQPTSSNTAASSSTTNSMTSVGADKANVLTQKNTIPAAFQRAYQATQQADYAKGDWQINSMATSLKTITPLVSTDYYASVVQSYVLESLLTRDPNTLEWNGLLAKDWQVSDDGLVYTFQLRDNIYFSDGEKMDANDVAFTFNFIMNEKIKAPRERAYYKKIESVVANNDYEVTFTFKEPYFKAMSLAGGMSILAEHFYSPYLKEPETFNQSKGLLLGTGPYRLVDAKNWRSDQSNVELIRNERYWGAIEPSYDKVVWKVIQNASARLATYRNGELDSYGARPIEYQKLKNDKQITEKSQNFEYMEPLASYSYIGWNQQRKNQATPFADKRVRQAMTFITDRQKIIEDIYLGYAEIAVSPFSPRGKQHDPTLKARPYDLQKAKALLTQAGYTDRNGDGIIEDSSGKPFSFALTFFKDNEDTKRIVLLLKDL
ncbi:MAG TPA: ABC transporter substrate-binding protein, partial [Thiothrix sp.]|nr:ABC transporter substrate-binding protein [Thiothrix sp.]